MMSFPELRLGKARPHTDRLKGVRRPRRPRKANPLELLESRTHLSLTTISLPHPTEVATTRMPNSKKTPKHPSRMLISQFSCVSYLKQTDVAYLQLVSRLPSRKTPRNPSRMSIAHLSCDLSLEQTHEIRADFQGPRKEIVGDSLSVGIRFGRRFRWDYPMAVRRVRIAISRRVVRGPRSVPARPRSSKTPFECAPRESGKYGHRHKMALGWLVAQRARASAGRNPGFCHDETLLWET